LRTARQTRFSRVEQGAVGTDLLAGFWKKRYILRLQWHLITVLGFVQLQ
jgi:hypothetical protein